MPKCRLGLIIKLLLKTIAKHWRRSREKQKKIKALENKAYKESLNELGLFNLVKESHDAL